MIVPSIDLMSQRAVQLIGGETLEIDAGDPRPIADRFGRVGEVAVIDLDAALGRPPQTETVRDLLQRAKCRVGGGIRSPQAAIDWLDAGAEKVILGTAATPDVLSKLPKDRVIAALDARDGEVLSHGWTRGTGTTILERIEALRRLKHLPQLLVLHWIGPVRPDAVPLLDQFLEFHQMPPFVSM